VEELRDVVAANTPVFHLHPNEQYFPCTVEYFLESARLCIMRNRFMRRTIERVVVPYGQLDADMLKHAYDVNSKQRLQLHLRRSARPGQPELLPNVPIYAHIRETVDPSGQRDALEIVYLKFFAFNGPYKPFGVIPAPNLGTHDSDWEHITVRLTPDGRNVTGVYYSCHRHIDGTWRSADEVPRTPEGRPRAFVAINGHGSYPYPGRIIRLFGAFNDNTSDAGPVWDPQQVVLVSPSGKLPSVPSRGDSLNGTAYASLGTIGRHSSGNGSSPTASNDGAGSSNSTSGSGGSTSSATRGVSVTHTPDPPWLQYGGKWGSTVVAPALQEWFEGAENPVSRTWLQTVFFPLVPGVDTLLEPVVETAEDVQQYVSDQVTELQTGFQETAEDARVQLEAYQKQLREYFDEFLAPGDNGDDSTSARSEHNQADDSDHVFGDEDSNTKNRK